MPEVPPTSITVAVAPSLYPPFGLCHWQIPATAFALRVGTRVCRLTSPMLAGGSKTAQSTGLRAAARHAGDYCGIL